MSFAQGFKTLKLSDQTLQRFQQNVASAFAPITSNPMLNGVIASFTVKSFTAAGIDIVVGHGLGQTPTGIIPLVAQQSLLFVPNATFVQSSSVNPNSSQLMILKCSSDLQIGAFFAFWVF